MRAANPYPEWITQAEAVPLPDHSPDAKAFELLDDKLITVQGDERAVVRYRIAIK